MNYIVRSKHRDHPVPYRTACSRFYVNHLNRDFTEVHLAGDDFDIIMSVGNDPSCQFEWIIVERSEEEEVYYVGGRS